MRPSTTNGCATYTENDAQIRGPREHRRHRRRQRRPQIDRVVGPEEVGAVMAQLPEAVATEDHARAAHHHHDEERLDRRSDDGARAHA